MSVALKLFDNYYINTNFLPSSIQYEQFDIDFIDEYFVVSKTLDNQIISYYSKVKTYAFSIDLLHFDV